MTLSWLPSRLTERVQRVRWQAVGESTRTFEKDRRRTSLSIAFPEVDESFHDSICPVKE